MYYLNNLFLFYLISAVPNELCKNWSWRPSEHSILRIYNLKQDIEKETQHKLKKFWGPPSFKIRQSLKLSVIL